jgi:uncharacterized protein YbjT (DUF2867 family)
MKMVVIGGTGRIGSHVVRDLQAQGQVAVAASPCTGVNTMTGEGVPEALTGADVVIDVSNSRSILDSAVLEFFETSTRNLLASAAATGVQHYVALSVVGTDRLAESGYFRAKIAQEQLIRESGLPYTIVHATQFFEFLGGIADAATEGKAVRLAPAFVQPMAAADVAEGVARVALGAPVHGVVEIAGPEAFRLDEMVREELRARSDPRVVITDPHARYFGAALRVCTLIPGESARLGATHFADWLTQITLQQ